MKKNIFILLIAGVIMCSALMFASCSCSCGCDNSDFYIVTIDEVDHGVVNVSLVSGEKVAAEQKYLKNSVVKVETIPGTNSELISLKIGDSQIDISTMTFTPSVGGQTQIGAIEYKITKDTQITAEFKRTYYAQAALARIEEAFFNTYDLEDYDEADGVQAQGAEALITMDGFNFIASINLAYDKVLMRSYIQMKLSFALVPDMPFTHIPIMEICYYDNYQFPDTDVSGSVLFIDIIITGDKYFVPLTIPYIFLARTALESRIPEETEEENPINDSELSSLDALEELGIIFDIENQLASGNNAGFTSLSFDIERLLNAAGEATDELPDSVDSVPPSILTLRVDYVVSNGVERIKANNGISGKLTITQAATATQPETTSVIDFTLRSMSLSTWNDLPAPSTFDPTGAEETTITELSEILLDIIRNIGNYIPGFGGN